MPASKFYETRLAHFYLGNLAIHAYAAGIDQRG